LEDPRRDVDRIVLPPSSFLHEREKVNERWPAAVRFIEERRLNEFFAEGAGDIGIIVQGGSYNALMRALLRLGVADVYGRSRVPLYVMNVAYPVIDSEVLRFCEGKRAVLMVEEGQPNFIEQNIAAVMRQGGLATALHGKDMLTMAGEYTLSELLKGARAFLAHYGRVQPVPATTREPLKGAVIPLMPIDASVNARPPGFCTGCPERP